MSQKNSDIYIINGLRSAIAQILTVALNQHWTDAAFGRRLINRERFSYIIRVLKEHALKMLAICQCQSNYVLWKEVKRKRKGEADNPHHSNKKNLGWKEDKNVKCRVKTVKNQQTFPYPIDFFIVLAMKLLK